MGRVFMLDAPERDREAEIRAMLLKGGLWDLHANCKLAFVRDAFLAIRQSGEVISESGWYGLDVTLEDIQDEVEWLEEAMPIAVQLIKEARTEGVKKKNGKKEA